MKKECVAKKELVANCGLYCGACGKFLAGKCPGCQKNEKASWCKIRSCCAENTLASCADCKTHSKAMDCKKFNNPVSKIFALLFRSDRQACIDSIKAKGYEGHAEAMAFSKSQAIKK